MKVRLALLFVCVFVLGFAQEEYPVHEDSKVKTGVPQGKVLGPYSHESMVFPETVREYFIYVPAQYQKEEPAALMVSFDGDNMAVNKWNIPTVLDNLIHSKEVPVTIGVFIGVGVQKSQREGTYDRPVRSVEYDSRGPELATMVIDEILPKVKAQYSISDNAKDHLIAGNSSGGNAAFNVAWERPDVFSRVFTAVGSYTSLRDGHEFLTLVRKTEHKPLRIYLQDGSNDLDNFSGNWFLANQYFLSSLQGAGYEVNHTWGEDTHGYRHAAAIMPDILRWLWKDYPKSVGKTETLGYGKDVLLAGETWQVVTKEVHDIQTMTGNQKGEVFFLDGTGTILYKIAVDGKVAVVQQLLQPFKGLAFSEKGELCSCSQTKKQVLKIYPNDKEVIASDIDCDALLTQQRGIYFLKTESNRLGFYDFDTKASTVLNSIENPIGISLSAEQNFLNITDGSSVHGYSVALSKAGTPKTPLAFFHYVIPYGKTSSMAQGIVVDQKNRTYTATALGIQVSDALGRTTNILPMPDKSIPVQLCFGGELGNTLFTATETGIYTRKMKQKGAQSWANPIAIEKPMHVKPIKK